MLNALETGKRNLICSNKQIIIQPTTAILRPFTFVKSDLSQNKRFSALLNNQLNIKSLIEQLNAALSEEWLAYYQYWVGALVVEGAMRTGVQGEFEEHAEEERQHAQLIADRIIELEGTPVLDPKQWFELARCKYDTPTQFDTVSLLNQNVASERCAILRYQEIAKFTEGKDYTTCDIAKHILAEEEDHEQDLQDYLNDIAKMKESFLKK